MKAKLITLLVGLVLPLASVFAGETTTSEAGDLIVIGMSVLSMDYPPMTDLESGAKRAAATLGARIVTVDSMGLPSKQSNDLKGFVAQGVQGILLVPITDDSQVSAIEAAVPAGIPVAALGKVNTDKVLVQVTPDDVEGGRLGAQFIIDKLGNKGSVIALEGLAGSSAATDRKAGFEEAIKKSNVTILASQTADWRRHTARSVMAGLIEKYPDFDAVWSASDPMLIGAIQAMSDANIDVARKVTVGFDALPDAFHFKISATIDPLNRELGAQALEYLVNYIKNKTMPPKKVILITPRLVTKVPGGTCTP